MKTKYENGILSFVEDSEDEKIFCVTGTKYGDGDRFVRFMTEEEINKEIPDVSDWSMPFDKMEVGDTSTYSYWLYAKANVVVRVA